MVAGLTELVVGLTWRTHKQVSCPRCKREVVAKKDSWVSFARSVPIMPRSRPFPFSWRSFSRWVSSRWSCRPCPDTVEIAMALIPCPSCQRPVSDRARACPKCGFQMTDAAPTRRASTPLPPEEASVGTRRRLPIVVACVGGAAAVSAIVVFALTGRTHSSPMTTENKTPSPPVSAAAKPDVRSTWHGPQPFEACQDGDPTRIAVTYITADRPLVPAQELKSWFRDVDVRFVDV